MGKILLVDDDKGVLDTFEALISGNGHYVQCARDAYEGVRIFKRENFDIILSDLKMPGLDGVGFLREVRQQDPYVGFIMLTAYPSTNSVVYSMKLLADDFLEKPITDFDKFNTLIETLYVKVSERRRVNKESMFINTKIISKEKEKIISPTYSAKNIISQEKFFQDMHNMNGFIDFVGNSYNMRKFYEIIKKVAPTEATVLIKGETGTGKEMAARAIHRISKRRDKIFIPFHCASIPDTLLSSELFGYEKGAFTGADKNKEGLFESAHEGTVFLDEIADISPRMQLQLLRVLQEKEIMRIGSHRLRKVDVRIIAASNKNLLNEVRNGRFREDLYFRLDVLSVQVPVLRDRIEDIPLLVNHFTANHTRKHSLKRMTYTPEALKSLMQYSWPGNIRELINVVERAVIMEDGDIIKHFPINAHDDDSAKVKDKILKGYGFKKAKQFWIEKFERGYLTEHLKRHNGNIAATANYMGVDVKTVWRKIKQYGLKIEKNL